MNADSQQPSAEEIALLQERKTAREVQQKRNDVLFERHQRVIDALFDVSTREAMLKGAQEQIALWEKGRLCHRSYITTWRRILTKDKTTVRKIVLATDAGGQGYCLRQNSPFGWFGADHETR